MKERRDIVVLVFLANSVVLLWTVLPDQGLIKPFPLSDQEIYFQTYIWIATIYMAFLILTWVMFQLSDKLRQFFNVVFILQALQFVEYFCNYNQTWFHITLYDSAYTTLSIPVNIAMIRFPILLFFAVKTFVQWKV